MTDRQATGGFAACHNPRFAGKLGVEGRRSEGNQGPASRRFPGSSKSRKSGPPPRGDSVSSVPPSSDAASTLDEVNQVRGH